LSWCFYKGMTKNKMNLSGFLKKGFCSSQFFGWEKRAALVVTLWARTSAGT